MRRVLAGFLDSVGRRSFATCGKHYNNSARSTRRKQPIEELSMTNIVLVLTTVGEKTDAESLARVLVEERLAACVTIGAPMTSVYRWNGGIERSGERQLVIKTSVDRLDALQNRIDELHSYDLPEFLVLPIAQGSERYLSWIVAETAPDPVA
jgi:periplasmic divalent cation tolerance protein